MIILLGKDGKYGMGNDFPIFTLPLDMEGATSQSLEDYQWWAYSSDFKKWLKANPRDWVADSEDTTKYTEISQLIREYFNGNQYPSLNENDHEGRVLKFGDYISEYDPIYEDESSDADLEKKITKFHFAYNKLLAEGKLDQEYVVANQKEGDDKAVFLSLDDDQGENDISTLDAYKIAPLKGGNPDAKFVLFEIKDRKLAGPLEDNSTGSTLAEDAIKTGFKAAAYGAAGLAIWTGIKYAGGAFAARRAWKQLTTAIGKGRGVNPAVKSGSKYWRLARMKGKKGLRSLWGFVKDTGMDLVTLKSLRAGASAVGRGAKGAKASYTLGKTGVSGAMKAFGKGASRGFTKGGGKLIPLVGEVLMVIDAVGSTWNWYSGKQAPRYGEVEDFAKETFDPKQIEIGVPITVCWSQPAGGWGGAAVSFLFNNETRTTMELVKVAEREGKSIFILTQINSKEVQKQISKFDVTLVAFDNSDPVERGWFDNEDLDFEMASYSQDLAAIFNYQGSCPWNEFEDAYNEASDKLLISDPDAPQEYEFHFKDSEDDVINVIGRKVTDEELSKYNNEDLSRIFGVDSSVKSSKDSNIDIEDQKKDKEAEIVEDSVDNSIYNSHINERAISSFADFKRGITSTVVNEVDASGEAIDELSSEQKSSPAKVSIYIVTEKDYANPELRGKYIPGKFTNFLVDEADLKAREGDSIDVDINTNEVLEDEKRGLYKYVKPEKDEEDGKIKQEVQPADKDDEKEQDSAETETKTDDYYFTVNPKDVEIKDRKNSTSVKDTSFKDGVNLFDKLLTTRDKETLKIENWKTVTFAKEVRDNRGDIIEVKFRNKYAPFGDKSRKYRAIDGEAFEVAKKFVEEAKDRIKYE